MCRSSGRWRDCGYGFGYQGAEAGLMESIGLYLVAQQRKSERLDGRG